MIKSFKHRGLKKFFLTGVMTGIQPNHANRLQLILARLHASQSPLDMDLPGLYFHPLKGSLQDYYAVRVSKNWRVIFTFHGENAAEVNLIDYH